MAAATRDGGSGPESQLSTNLNHRTKVITTLREQWALLSLVCLAAWWVRDGLSNIEHAIERLSMRVEYQEKRYEDHESRIRVLEIGKGQAK